MITSKVIKGKEEEGAKYRDYFDFSEPLNRASSHRLLALRRGEAEGILRVSISPDAESCLDRLNRRFVKGRGEVSEQVATAVEPPAIAARSSLGTKTGIRRRPRIPYRM